MVLVFKVLRLVGGVGKTHKEVSLKEQLAGSLQMTFLLGSNILKPKIRSSQ